jgi:hypothetical protein
MPSKIRSSFILWTLFSITFATQAAGQQTPTPPKPHTRYKLVDLGTFGGPISKIPFAQRDLTKSGAVVGFAETDVPDPFSPNCASPSCKVQHGFTWRDGVMTELPGLIPNLESGAQAINEDGIVVGESQNGLIDPATALQPSTPFFGIKAVFSISAPSAAIPVGPFRLIVEAR